MTQMTKNNALVLGGIGVLLVLLLAIIFYPKVTTAPTNPSLATSTPETTIEEPAPTVTKAKGGGSSVPASAPSVPLSKVLLKDASSVSIYSGIDPSGRTVYKQIPNVDLASFVALTELDAIEHPSVKNGSVVSSLGAGSVAYYKDKNRVYVLSVFESTAKTIAGMQVVQDADPATFHAVSNPWYALDGKRVYRLEAPTNPITYAPGSYVWHPYDLKVITNADVKGFTLVTDPKLNYDAHDSRQKYRKGVVVGMYP